MSITEFVSTKLLSLLFVAFVIVMYSFWLYQATSAYAYKRGWKDGLKDNANVVVVSEIIMDNYRAARFDPRTPGAFLLLTLRRKRSRVFHMARSSNSRNLSAKMPMKSLNKGGRGMKSFCRSDDEVGRVLLWVEKGCEEGTQCPDKSYEQGVVDTIAWLLGETDVAPGGN